MGNILSIKISIGPIIALVIGGFTVKYYEFQPWNYILWGLAFIWFVISLVYTLKFKSKKRKPSTIGIEANGSIINAPSAKIYNQDIAVKSKNSFINIPDVKIKNDKKVTN